MQQGVGGGAGRCGGGGGGTKRGEKKRKKTVGTEAGSGTRGRGRGGFSASPSFAIFFHPAQPFTRILISFAHEDEDDDGSHCMITVSLSN